jgi:hypothetical protein
MTDEFDLPFVVEGFRSLPEDGMVSLDLEVVEPFAKNIAFLLFSF